MTNSVHPTKYVHRSLSSTMRISLLFVRFLSAGLITLAVVAAANWFPVPVSVEATAPAADGRPPMFVLQVGIGKYKHAPTWAELRGAPTDVLEMRKVLESERWKIPSANIVTLAKEGEGTKKNILENFRNHLIARAREHNQKTNGNRDAVVLFQFSGHGSQAPDQDGDEKDDSKDETLVTYDSQDAPGQNFDISDDEIYALTSELKLWTDNIVYILDSCHSGSGTRNGEDVRRLPERKNPVVPLPGFAGTTRSGGTAKTDDGTSRVLPPGSEYIVITAARSNELASQKQCFEECGDARRPVVYGNLTFYLIDELKNARADTTYRELMENVARRVSAEKPTQTPQIEGNKGRFVFGSLASTEDNFVRIADPGAPNTSGSQSVKIAAGAMQGLTIDTVVSFYDKTVARFDQAEPVATGLVKSIAPSESTVVVTELKRPIKADDKASVVTTDLGALKVKVNLDADAAKLTAAQKNVIDATRIALAPGDRPTADVRSIQLVTPQHAASGRWDVAILKDRFSTLSQTFGSEVNCEIAGTKADAPRPKTASDKEVFYVAGKDYIPLYRFCLDASESDAKVAAERLREVVLHLAHIKSVNAIANRRSALNGKVFVKPIRLTGPFGCDQNSLLTYGTSAPVVADPKTGHYPFSTGEVLWLEVTNNSPRDLYLTLLDLAPDGSITVLSPRSIDSEKDGVKIQKGGKRILIDDTCRQVGSETHAGAIELASGPGLENFKLIASVKPTTRDEFAFLEIGALAKRGRRASVVGLDDWTTVETILQISDTGE